MRYSGINTCECINGLGWGVSLFTQGCPIHCEGCFNSETWDFNGGKLLMGDTESKIYQAMRPEYITRFSILGGEPLIENNLKQLNYMLCTIKSNWPNKKVWIWTGYTWDELQNKRKQLYPDFLYVTFLYTDYLVCGPYIQEQKDLTLKWRGSSNQQILDMQQTMTANKPILALL